MARSSFREQVLVARERAIVEAVNRLLSEKGFEAMTVDAVAAEVGIAKASLYKHFKSKEDLAAAAMIGVLDRALALIETLQRDATRGPRARLEAVTRWAMQAQLDGEMPSLPAQNSALRSALMENRAYLDRLMQVSDLLGEWILAAQAAGELDASLPPEVILYTIYARGCDPVSGILKVSANFTDERIVEMLLSTCFRGLAGTGASPA
ncbi:MAG TPA: helix-turn-helix domain-containing protein [Burkholderiaceae bacterium]